MSVIAMNAITNIMILVFAEIMYPHFYVPNKKRSKYEKIIVIIGISLGLTICQHITVIKQIAVLKMINYAFVVVTVNIYNRIFYKPEGCSYVIINTVSMFFLLLIEFISVIVMPTVSHKTINEYLENDNLIVSYLIYWFLMYVFFQSIYIFVKKYKENIPSITGYGIAAYIVLFVFEVIMIGYTIRLASDETATTVLIVVLSGYFMINMLVAYLIMKISGTGKVKYENEMLHQQSMTQMTTYVDLLEKYETSQKTAHDMEKHLRVLSGLISEEDEKAKEYLSNLTEEVESFKPVFRSNSAILDVIINHKILQSKLKGINFEIEYDETDMSFISDMDITVILANTLDNAYEAVENLEREQRNVKLVISLMAGLILINISNNYYEVNKKPDGGFLSTKKNHYGIGLKNVRETVKKYDGLCEADVVADKFIIRITIPYVDNERSM